MQEVHAPQADATASNASPLAFPVVDAVVRHNLQRLDHLSRQTCDDGSFRLFEALVHASIGSLRMLPAVVGERIRGGGFYLGDTYVRMTPARRTETWSRLAVGLREDIATLSRDRDFWNAAANRLADRPRTRGERLLEICDALDRARRDGLDMNGLARRLEMEASGTEVWADARQLVRLIGRRRVSDWNAHLSEIVRLIHHARLISERLHHLD